MSNPNYPDIIASTIESRSTTVFDNITNNNALLMELKRRGNTRPWSGGYAITESVLYNPNANATFYKGYETLPVAAQDAITLAKYDPVQVACAVTMSGLEDLQNSGKEAKLDLMTQRIAAAEASMDNIMASSLYSDGTGFGGKEFVGLSAAVVKTPTSGSIGGINRATANYWRNYSYTLSGVAGVAAGTVAYTSIYIMLTDMWAKTKRGKDSIDLFLLSNAAYISFAQGPNTLQRFVDSKTADAGFEGYSFNGAKIVCDGGIKIPGAALDGTMEPSYTSFPAGSYLALGINTRYMFLRTHPDRNMVPAKPATRTSVNQDAVVQLLLYAGALSYGALRYHAYGELLA
jgi:hypothetical protein